jgi:protease I
MRQALLIIAQRGYQDHELDGTRQGLLSGGFSIVLSSTEAGECIGKFGGSEQSTVALRDVRVKDYDCIAFIGGPGASALASDTDALRVANDAARADMPLGAICIAPTILAKARVLNGRKATVWNEDGQQSQLLEQYGAEYTGDTVTVDGKIVTGNGPGAAVEFGTTLATLQ